jgi:tetratricopeptide (TPR) repeat protein
VEAAALLETDPAGARALHERILRIHPGSLPSTTAIAELSFQLGDGERFHQIADRAIRLARSNNDVFGEQALKNLAARADLAEGGDLARVDRVFTATVLSSNGSYMGCAWQGLGEMYAQLDSAPRSGGVGFDAALDAYVAGDAASALAALQGVDETAWILLRGLALTTLRRYDEADRTIAGLPPNSVAARVGRAHAALARQDGATARALLDGLPPGEEPLIERMRLLGLGWTDANAGRPAAAEVWFDQLLGQDPDDVLGLLGRANSRVAQGGLAAARADYEHVLRRQPSNRHALAGIATVDLDEGRLDAAESGFRAAIGQSDGRFTCPYEGLGLVYLQRGAVDQAAEWFDRAIEANPAIDHVKYTLLARIRWDEGRPDEAERLVRRALQNHPGDPDAQALLDELLGRAP